MKLSELNSFLEANKHSVLWKRTEEDSDTIYIKSTKWDTIIQIDLKYLPDINEQQIIHQLCAGKDVEQMTRVTGYFSKIAGWNKGKTGELKERYRSQTWR